MSYVWGAFENEKWKIISGSVLIGIVVCLLIGLPLMLLLKSYGYYLPIWFWVIFAIVVLSLVTLSCYKSGCKRLKKGN